MTDTERDAALGKRMREILTRPLYKGHGADYEPIEMLHRHALWLIKDEPEDKIAIFVHRMAEDIRAALREEETHEG